MRSIDDVIAVVDVDGVARDQLGTVKCEEGNRLADVLDAHQLRVGALPCAFDSSSSNPGIPEAAPVASGPGEMARTRMPFGPTSEAT